MHRIDPPEPKRKRAPKNPRRMREQNMEDFVASMAKKTPHDCRLFYRYFVQRGTDIQTARNLALAKDGTGWH
jgi:hypothetical protein